MKEKRKKRERKRERERERERPSKCGPKGGKHFCVELIKMVARS